MSRQNPFQHIASELADELKHSRSKANRSKVVPFGLEQVSRRDALNRVDTLTRADLETMPQEQYQELVKSIGQNAILEIAGRENPGTQSGSFL